MLTNAKRDMATDTAIAPADGAQVDAASPLRDAASPPRGDADDGSFRDVERQESSLAIPEGRRMFLEGVKVNYSVGKVYILKDLDVSIPPGKLVALMGPSGSGKTTLINVLAGRGGGKVGGTLNMNGTPLTRERMRRECRVVPQLDVMQPVLTARETLQYTAELSMKGSRQERQARVNQMLEDLSLSECADVQCGGPNLKGLSGGQLKRVSMAMELLADPSCLMLDEPTSGLDSKVAEDVVEVILKLARGGRTVICTIHQPSFQVFSKFQHVIMLEKGRVAYDGKVKTLSGYLENIGQPTPQFVNPADHMMQVLAGPVPDNKAKTFLELFESSAWGSLAREAREKIAADRADYMATRKPDASARRRRGPDDSPEPFAVSYPAQSWIVARRAFYVTTKDKRQLRTRAFQLTFIGLIIGTIFLRMERTQNRVQDRLSVLFMIILFLGMSSVMGTAMALPAEKNLMVREYLNGYYGLTAYYLGRMAVLLLFQVIYAVVFGSCLYFTLGLYPSAGSFLTFLLALVIISVIAGELGFTTGVIFPTPQAASAATPMLIMPLVIFAGLFIPVTNIPPYWVWVYYLSFFQYALQIMMVNEFEHSTLDACSVDEIFKPTGLCPYGACSSNLTDPQPCPGTVVLNRLDYDPDNLWFNFLILAGFAVLFCGTALLALRRLVRNSS